MKLKKLGSITATAKLEGNGSLEDPWTFAKEIEYAQEAKYSEAFSGHWNLLFNKGRYFEMSAYNKEIADGVCDLLKIELEYNMIVGSWKQLEDLVIAMNCYGIYICITVDWI